MRKLDIEQANLYADLVSLILFEHRVKPRSPTRNKRLLLWLHGRGALDDVMLHVLMNELNLCEA